MSPGPDFPERGEEGVGYADWPRRAAVAQVSATLAGPVLFLLALTVKFLAVNAACHAGSTVRLHLFAALFLAAALVVAFVSHRAWQRHERPARDEGAAEGAPDRRRTVMLVALMLSLLFTLGVVYLWLPVFFLDPCRT